MTPPAHATDIEISRALNALVCTLNDQGDRDVDVERLQGIVTGALGGERRLDVIRELGAHPAARLEDHGHVRARVWLAEGRWTSRREGAPLSGAYIPD